MTLNFLDFNLLLVSNHNLLLELILPIIATIHFNLTLVFFFIFFFKYFSLIYVNLIEAAFFSGVTEPINNNTNNNQQNTTTPAVKPSKESILSLYGSQPTNNVNNNINGQTPMRTVPSANYNVVLPGLG